MKQKLLNDLVAAMKNQDKETLSVLRMVKGAIQLEEINKKSELTDDDFVGVVSKQIKTRKESIAEFEKAGRTDLVEQTTKEIEILNKYMPEQLSEEEILKVIDEAFDTVNPQAQSDMGKLMGFVTPKLKGKADMSFVSKTIKEKLANL
ncbi:MAG: GatB/YqeY domain-containing protein [Firmicutes bacterium]|nr:GatB/YqeY domain-containing protein [Bacillota bacterium]